MCLEIIYIYIYMKDLALDNQQWLICHKTKPNQAQKISYNSFGLESFFDGISTFVGYLIPRPSLKKNSNRTIYTHNRER